MANVFFDPGEQRASRVHDLFAAIAPRYDLINDLQSFGLHRRWKRRAVQLARARPGDTALDVCSGTGDLAFALAQRGTTVVGLDFSEAMLRIAAKRSRKAAAENPRFIRGDAQDIPFPDASFDIVTMGYGLRNLKSWETGVREMQRVARPGGRLVVLEFGKPDNALWRGAYFTYLRWFVPLLGKLVCSNAAAYGYILESLENYPAQHGVEAFMAASGLKNIRTLNLLGGVMSINYAEKP